MPLRMFSSVSISRCARSSASRSPSSCRLRNRPRIRAPKIRSRPISGSFRTAEKPGHKRCHTLPTLGLCKQLFAPSASERVILRLAVIFGSAPFGRDPAALLEPQQGWIERALVQLEQILGNLLNPLSDAVAVQRAHGMKGLQNNQIERALQDFS